VASQGHKAFLSKHQEDYLHKLLALSVINFPENLGLDTIARKRIGQSFGRIALLRKSLQSQASMQAVTIQHIPFESRFEYQFQLGKLGTQRLHRRNHPLVLKET